MRKWITLIENAYQFPWKVARAKVMQQLANRPDIRPFLKEGDEFLDEEWFHTVKYGNAEYDILRNPDRRDLMRMIQADQFKQVRAICTPEDVYVFTAEMSHGDVQSELRWNLWDKARIFIDRNGPYINESDDMAVVGTDQDYENEKDRDLVCMASSCTMTTPDLIRKQV